MREILVISGKGGTGKTSITAAFAHLAADAIICDLDVDAPDLHLLLQPKRRQTHEFYSGHEACINPDRCDGCGICSQVCRYDAVRPGDAVARIDPLKCEGCRVCVTFCPSHAINFTPKHCGAWFVSDTRFGTLVHAQLTPGEENSGRLVALLRQKAKALADAQGAALILGDGPPGIGCPVISAMTGVDLAVIVTEPTPSGLHDLERIISLCRHFKLPVSVIINKSDLNPEITGQIESLCLQGGFSVAAKLPHVPAFVQAMIRGQAVTEYSNGVMVQQLKQGWHHILALVGEASDCGIMAPRTGPQNFESVAVKGNP